MIHVFLVVHNFSGALTYSDQLAICLSKRQDLHIYKVYLDSIIYSEFNVITEGNIESVYLPRNFIKDFDAVYYDRVALLLYARYKQLQNVIFHFNAKEQFWFGKRIKELFRSPILFTLHFLNASYSFADKTNVMDCVSKNKSLERIIGLADHIICVTSFAQQTISKFFNIEDSKSTLIYNGVLPFVYDSSSIDKCKYGFNAKDKLILYAGQLEPRKGINKLIQAFLIIKDKYPETKLIIAGTGLYDSYLPLAQTCMGRICFVGKLDKNTLFDFYSFCEVGVISSQFEQCSYVAIEMMFSKLPLIISDVPGLNELVIHLQTGLVCKTNLSDVLQASLEADETDLALQLEYVLENPTEVKNIVTQAYQFSSKYHLAEAMGEKTIEVYINMLNSNRTSFE